MTQSYWRLVTALVVVPLGISWFSEAEALTWSVKNSAGTAICSGTTGTLPATCGTVLQFQSVGGTARVEAVDGGANDILQLVNTKIVATADVSNYVMTFEHTFAAPPTKSDYTPIYYRTHMYGNISNSPTSNSLVVTSTIENPVGTVLLSAGPLSSSSGASSFDIWQSPSAPDVSGNRRINVNMTFTLANTKYLYFPAGRFVKVSAQSYPDPKPDLTDMPAGDTTALHNLISEVLRVIEGGGSACLGVSLPDSVCSGMYFTK